MEVSIFFVAIGLCSFTGGWITGYMCRCSDSGGNPKNGLASSILIEVGYKREKSKSSMFSWSG